MGPEQRWQLPGALSVARGPAADARVEAVKVLKERERKMGRILTEAGRGMREEIDCQRRRGKYRGDIDKGRGKRGG